MRAVVTGGAGFIGSAIARALRERGDDVVVFDDLSSGSEGAVPGGATLIVGDIKDLDATKEAFTGAEVIFHQAALRSVPRSLDEPALVHETNASGTLYVLLAAEAVGARKVVYASSSSVYGGALEGVSREDMPVRPLSPYAVSKVAGEMYCTVWSSLGRISTISLRYFNVFGPGQSSDSKYAAVFPAFISALKRGEAPEIHWDGEQSRDFTYIDDVVRANLLAGDGDETGVMNIARGSPRSVNSVFTDISRILGTSIEPRRVPKRPGDIRDSHADVSRAGQLLSWKAESEWDEAVRATVGWFG